MSLGEPETTELLAQAYALSCAYVEDLPTRRVFPNEQALANLSSFDEPMPQTGSDAFGTLELLQQAGAPASVACTGGRYFGFVTGGVFPVALAANWMAGTWDQNTATKVMSPIGQKLEQIAGGWIKSMTGLPTSATVSFVTGATMASFTAIAAARSELLARQGWDLKKQGLFGAPMLRVIISAETHITIKKALAMLGFGEQQIETVAVDDQGRMNVAELPELDETCLVLCQAGNVNSGAFDDIKSIIAAANGAWVHVDGAFGLWARLVPEMAHLTDGLEQADSWSVDGHKWLNTPYDCGISIVKNRQALECALATNAAYLRM